VTASRRRVGAVIVIVVAFIALAAFALMARAYRPGRAGVPLPSALSLNTARDATPIASTTALAAADRRLSAGARNLASGNAAAPTFPGGNAPPPPSGPSGPSGPSTLAPCPLGLAVPTEQAGLANLVPLVPFFGPFSPEAFAMVPAFEPGFPLFGPAIIAGGEFLGQLDPALSAAAPVVNGLEDEGFTAVSPLYRPVRPQVLAGEAQLAATLRPHVAAFASSPGASCVPAALAVLL
jgi:hypothetical protein